MIVCTVASPKQTVVYKNTRSVALPAFFGRMQVLPGHAESFILLKKGSVRLRRLNKQDKIIQIRGGECHIKNNKVAIIL